MYTAKRTGSRQAVYDPEQDAAHRSRRTLINALRYAIDHDQLVLHYQPAVKLDTGRLEILEALVRWQHPESGLLPPDTFIGLAEEAGLMEPLTLWVLQAALQECQRWHQADRGSSPCVAVNLSAVSLRDGALGETISSMLRQSAVDASSLTLELTESAVMAEPERAMRILSPLHEMGVRIVIDDFGTGYSSLAYLSLLPVDGIKIDRSFIRNLTDKRRDSAIVRSVIDLGHDLHRTVTAEGVEDDASYRLLASMGCDFAQGYYIAPPLPVSGVREWLRRHEAPGA
jgi:EAL domain-containing protein (putative c-di-GMP-specific phosphodiesterase class I)